MSMWDRDVDGNVTQVGLDEQASWLNDDSEKIIIVDVQFHNGIELVTGHFSNFPYIMPFEDSSLDFDGTTVLQNIAYEDNLISIPNIISRIDSDINIGSVEFLNSDGEFDNLITYAWEGHPLRIYMGAKDWVKDDFIIIIEAISSVISSPRPNIMSLSIRDKKEVFDRKVQEVLVDEDYVVALYASADLHLYPH
jgi:hypothetical protein